MHGKTLRRCDLCGKFHAAYLVPKPQGGQMKLCRSCWTDTATQKNPQQLTATEKPTPPNVTD
jgi:hypothetical protein